MNTKKNTTGKAFRMIYGVKLLQWILSASTCDPVTQFVKSTRPYGT